jgi:hypothetical protein
MDNYSIFHYVEKTYYDGSIKTELVKERDPLSIKDEVSLVAIRFFDRNKPTETYMDILKGKPGEPYNYSNYYFYGERKNINSLEKEYKLLEGIRPGTNNTLKDTINTLLMTGNDEIIINYRPSPFKPYEVFPREKDMTIGEYKLSLKNQKVLKK